jgi:glycosyltransferase involved in cell wall biosynthesis
VTAATELCKKAPGIYRVILAAGKRGHYYLTARALRDEGVLARFVTGLFFGPGIPWRRARSRSDAGLKGAPVVSLWPVEGLYRATCLALGKRRALMRAYNAAFDLATIPFLRGGDTFHVANTYALKSGAAARRAGMRVVLDQQSVHPLYRREALRHAYGRLRSPPPPFDFRTDERIARELEEADLILAPSRFVFDENVRAGIPAERQRVVPLGVDTRFFRPMPRVRQPDEPLQVLLAGGIAPAKGVIDLLEAARRVGGRVRVTLVGRVAPGMQEHLAPYAHLFVYLPPMPQEELARCYHRADVFSLPSYFEGSALVVSEAMASGLPCVVTDAAGSLVEHGRDGLVVPAGDPAALADALAQLDADAALRARLGAAARRTAEAYDLASYGRRLVTAYGPVGEPHVLRRAASR